MAILRQRPRKSGELISREVDASHSSKRCSDGAGEARFKRPLLASGSAGTRAGLAWAGQAWLALVFLFWWGGAALGAPKVTAGLDREVVPLGESVTLSLVFEEVAPEQFPGLPPLPDLNLTSRGQSSQFTLSDGQSSSTKTFSYVLAPTRAGDFIIPAIQFQAGGRAFTTQPLRLKVTKGEAAANPDAALASLAFLRLVVSKTEVYVGEPFPVEIHLYYKSVQDVQTPQLNAEGFSIGQSAKPTQTATRVGNENYNLVVFRMSATAAKAGTLDLGPAECSLAVRVPVNNPRRRDPFESFFGSGSVQLRPTTLRSEPISMQVLPLPQENIPEGFNGAVGVFSFSATAGPTNLLVGDPITVKTEITGRGMLDALALQPQPQWREFKVYPPSGKIQSNDPLGLSGVKSFEQVVIPQNHEIQELPPMRFSFFDPSQKRYRILSNAPIRLRVQSAASASLPSLTNAPAASNTPAPANDILHIKARLDKAVPASLPLVRQAWFLALQATPVLAWFSLFLRRWRMESLANNPRLRRQRQVAQRVKIGLEELRSLASHRHSEEFFATLFRLLQEQLGERLDLPASAITESIIEQRLRGGNLPEETLNSLHEMFQVCNKARYAPQKSGEELASLIPQSERLLAALQQWKA